MIKNVFSIYSNFADKIGVFESGGHIRKTEMYVSQKQSFTIRSIKKTFDMNAYLVKNHFLAKVTFNKRLLVLQAQMIIMLCSS